MLAGVRPLVLTNNLQSLLYYCPHFLSATLFFHIKNGTNVEAAYRGMSVEGASCSMFMKYLADSTRIFCKVLQIHRTVFDEGNRFSVTLHRHHNIETGFSYFPNRLLKFIIRRFDN